MSSQSIQEWLATPEGRRKAIYGASALTAVGAIGLIAIGFSLEADASPKKRKGYRPGAPDLRPQVPKGRLVCPYEEGKIPANLAQVQPNDFVILRLGAADMHYTEKVWGHVLSVSPDRSQLLVELSTPLTNAGLKPIHSEKHAFTIGEKLKVNADCVYDLLHKGDPERYEIVCGVLLPNLGYQGIPKKVLSVKRGDFVTVIVGNPSLSDSGLPGQVWHEPLRVSITSLGKTGSVLHGLVWDEPKLGEHGLQKFSKLDFTRDCIVKVT